jgi:hypothetical protein
MNRKRDLHAEKAHPGKLSRGFRWEAATLVKLKWQHIQRMEGVSPYMTQNVMKWELNRLRLWTREEHGFQCLASGYLGT